MASSSSAQASFYHRAYPPSVIFGATQSFILFYKISSNLNGWAYHIWPNHIALRKYCYAWVTNNFWLISALSILSKEQLSSNLAICSESEYFSLYTTLFLILIMDWSLPKTFPAALALHCSNGSECDRHVTYHNDFSLNL